MITLGVPDGKGTSNVIGQYDPFGEWGGHYHPFFLGDFQRRDAYAFHDNVSARAMPCESAAIDAGACPPGEKVVVVTINASLDSADYPDSNTQHDWKLFTLAYGTRQRHTFRLFRLRTSTKERRRRRQRWRYNVHWVCRPAGGLSNTAWLLTVAAGDRASGFGELPNKAGSGPSSLDYLYKERVYSVVPSLLTIEGRSTPQADGTEAQGTGRHRRVCLRTESGTYRWEVTCPPAVGAYTAVLQTFPGVSAVPDSFKWRVRELPSPVS